MTEQTRTNNFRAPLSTEPLRSQLGNATSRSEGLTTQPEPAAGPNMSVLRELVNVVALDMLLENPHLLRDNMELSMLARYRRELVDGVKTVMYAPTSHGQGRWYAVGGRSLQGFSKGVRHTLSHDENGRCMYHDIDVRNCHPVLLLQLCERHGFTDVRCLRQYVSEREECLQSVMSSCRVDRDAAKELFLRLLHGGKAVAWMRDTGVGEKGTLPAFVSQFESELEAAGKFVFTRDEFDPIRTLACSDNNDAAPFLHSSNPVSRCLSIVLQSVEFTLVSAMCAFFDSAGWRVGVQVFDGVQVYAKEEGAMSARVLRSCEEYVFNATGWKIELEEKPMDRGLDLRLLQAKSGMVAEDVWKQRYVERLLGCFEQTRWRRDSSAVGVILERAGMRKELFEDWARVELEKDESKKSGEGGQTDSSSDDQVAEMAAKVAAMQARDDWMVAVNELEHLAFRDNEKMFLEARPLLDLQCPYTIDDLLQARTEVRAAFIAPKVLARMTASADDVWIKKVPGAGVVQFVVMQGALKILYGNVFCIRQDKSGTACIKTVGLKSVVTTVVSVRGAEMNFAELDFFPYAEGTQPKLPLGTLNMFGGFPFREMRGSFHSTDWSPVFLILQTMRTVLCGIADAVDITDVLHQDCGDMDALEPVERRRREMEKLWLFVLDWFSDIVQNPARKPRVCLVFYSKAQQVGKGAIAALLCKALVGRYFNSVDDENHILGDFTSKLAKYFVLAVDESKRRGVSYESSGKLKNKITEPTCTVTYKGVDPLDIRSCHRFIYCVNWLDAIDIELFDQRFCVIECSSQLRGQKEVFEQFDAWIQEHAALLWNFFKKRPLERHWNRVVPMTDVKRSIIERKYPTAVQFAVRCRDFWLGQAMCDSREAASDKLLANDAEIRWHWSRLYGVYREWARRHEMECGVLRSADGLIQPLALLGIEPGSDQGRVRVQVAGKSSREKGFCIKRELLIDNVRAFLRKMGETNADKWEPPVEIDGSDRDAHVPE